MAVNPIERAVGRFLLGPVLRVVLGATCVLLVGVGAYHIAVGFVYLAQGEWLTMALELKPATTTRTWAETATAWGLIGLGAFSITVFGGRLFYNREIAHYRDWKKSEGHFRAVEQRKSFTDRPELSPVDDNNPPEFPRGREGR